MKSHLHKKHHIAFLPLLTCIVVLLSISFIYLTLRNVQKVEAAWYNDLWNYRVKLTVDHTKVGADQTDFPIYVDLSLLPSGFHQHVNQIDARDIRVTKGDGTTELPREVVNYDASRHTGELHVKYSDTLSSSTDTPIYIYYGNQNASDYSVSDTYGRNNVWDSNYKTVLHLNQASTGAANEFIDSTSNANHLSGNATASRRPARSTGKLNYAQNFTASAAQYLIQSSASNLGTMNASQTVSVWYKVASNPSVLQDHVCLEDTAYSIHSCMYFTAAGNIGMGSDWNSPFTQWIATTAPAAGSWHHIVWTWNGTTNRLYVDGTEATNNTTAPGVSAAIAHIWVGAAQNSNDTVSKFNGDIDEVQFSTTPRSATWISTQYNNQNSPSTFFLSTSKEEKNRSAVLSFTFDEGTGVTVSDGSANGHAGTLSGATLPTWQTEELCISGKCLYYNGTTAYVSVATTVPSVQSVSFWVRPKTTSETLIDFDGGTHYLSASSGTITATGFSSPTIYVNGVSGGTLVANTWQHIEVTTATAFAASAITIGKRSTFFLNGFVDEFRIYDYARSASQVLLDYAARDSQSGVAARFGSDDSGSLTQGLVGYWKMDETSWTVDCATGSVTDYSGAGNHGLACPNATGPSGGVAGKYGNSGQFDGVDNYVSINNSTVYAPMNAPFAASAWVYQTAFTDNYPVILRLRSDDTEPWFIIFSNQSGLLGLSVGNAGSFASIKTDTSAASLVGAWRHVTVSYNGQGSSTMSNFSLYLDGVLQTNVAGSAYSTNTQGTSIGYDKSGNELDGKIDEVRIYNRTLSPSEARQLYSWAPGPIGHWKMDENTGTTTTNDSSGNGNTGTMNGTMTSSDWMVGKYGSSLDFDGTDDYVSDTSVTWDFTGNPTKSFTLGAWFKPDSCSNGIMLSNDGGLTVAITGGDDWFFQLKSGGTFSFQNASCIVGTWIHVQGVYNADSTTLFLYLNGVLVDSDVVSSTDTSTLSDQVNIGRSSFAGYFDGLIDDVRVYNYPRTSGQVIEDMNAGHPAPGSPVGSPVAYWKFDEGALNTCLGGTNDFCDSSINANDLAAPPTTTILTNAGKFGKAFNASGAVLATRADDSDFDFAASDDLSMSMWLYADAADKPTSGNVQYVYTKGGIVAAGTVGYILYTNSSGNVSFAIRSTSGNWVATPPAEPTSDDKVTSTTDLYDSAWHHIVATKTGTSRIDLFVDGKLNASDTSLTATGTLANTVTSRFADRNETNDGDEFTGKIDEMKIFRSALTGDQIQVEYNYGSQSQMGALSTDSSNNPSNSNTNSYCPPGQGSACTPPIGHWKLDENTGTTAYDLSGNGYSGTLTNSPKWSAGKFGSGINTNSASAYINVGDPVDGGLDFNATDDFTISAWIRTSSTLPNNGEFLYKGFGGSDPGYRFRLANSTGYFNCEIADNAAGTTQLSSNGPALNDGVWHFVTCVLSGSGTQLTVYVDGIQRNTVADSEGTLLSAKNLEIGRNGATSYFPGDIDDVRIYRYARTQAQIAWDYNHGDPLLRWKFDENSGSPTTLNDSTGNGLSGAASGTMDSSDWLAGKLNTSLDFDGSDDVVSVANSSPIDLNVGLVQGFTFAAWIYPNTVGETAGRIFQKGTNGSTTDASTTFCRVTGSTPFGIECNLDLATSDAVFSVSSAAPANQWTHVAFSWTNDADDEVTIWINGVPSTSSASYSGDPTAEANSLYVAGNGTTTSNTRGFDGQIDDFRVYGYELTSPQVKTLMNEGALRFGP